ncbi:MAG: PIN domain-containing protein [bacterium]|nr:PIN domain-containing protein [bacterium]
MINTTTEEYAFAKEIESLERYTLSFYDCIHLAICIKRNIVLITRDKELLEKGNKYITTIKPEIIIY